MTDELKKQLDISGLTWETAADEFQKIAKTLMLNYIIQQGEQHYAIVEIEFYFYSAEHKDCITYPRKMDAGRWFFHQSGVDLTFKSVDKSFGGILIRGIYSLKTREYTFGPQKCVDLLWNNFDAFDNKNTFKDYPILVKAESHTIKDNIVSCPRCINIKEDDRVKKANDWAKRLSVPAPSEDDIQNIFDKPYRFFNLQKD